MRELLEGLRIGKYKVHFGDRKLDTIVKDKVYDGLVERNTILVHQKYKGKPKAIKVVYHELQHIAQLESIVRHCEAHGEEVKDRVAELSYFFLRALLRRMLLLMPYRSGGFRACL